MPRSKVRRARLDEPLDRDRAARADGDARRGGLPDAERLIHAWGPTVVVAKRGEFGAAMITHDGFFALPAFPLETVIDPTGAGDCFAGGFMGYLGAHPDEEMSHDLLTRA